MVTENGKNLRALWKPYLQTIDFKTEPRAIRSETTGFATLFLKYILLLPYRMSTQLFNYYKSRWFLLNVFSSKCKTEVFTSSSGNHKKNKMKMLKIVFLLVLILSAELVRSWSLDEVMHRISICHLPPVKGNCHAKIRRWFYSAKTRGCTQFFHSGCGGNENLFFSKAECEEFCQIVRRPNRESTKGFRVIPYYIAVIPPNSRRLDLTKLHGGYLKNSSIIVNSTGLSGKG